MSDLFTQAGDDQARRLAPLADRVRPTDLAGFVGQARLVGVGSALRRAIEEDRVPSAVFHGPPGTGKTTLARIIAHSTGAAFEELSAVAAGKAEVSAVIGRARERLGAHGQRTILFLDEIHRFNKTQQDALLPAVEAGLVTLIGATTENPYFALTSALLSRLSLFEFEPLNADDTLALVRRGALALGLDVDDEVARMTAEAAGGDARVALAVLELAAQTAVSRGRALGMDEVADAAAKRPLRYDRDGDQHYDAASALIKSMRGSDPDAAVYWLAVMLAGGEDPLFVARRMVIFASEDIGNADPTALQVAVAVARAVEFIGLPEARINLAQGATYLALAPKSNAAYRAIDDALREVREHGNQPPPTPLRDASYWGARKLGRGVGYRYPHDTDGFVADQTHLPDALRQRRFYEPSRFGFEAELGRRLAEWRRLRAEADTDAAE